MSRFTGDEFETAFGQVYLTGKYPFSDQCKTFLKDILTSDPATLYEYIDNISNSDNEATMIECIKSIMGSTRINDLTNFIKYIHLGITSDYISNTIQQRPEYNSPIFRISEKMLQNQRPPPSARPLASALPSERPPASAIAKPAKRAKPRSALPSARPSARPSALPSARPSAHPSALPSARPSVIAKDKDKDAEAERIRNWWALHDAGNTAEAQRLYGASVGTGGGSRRRRSSHRKRKSYRKSKRVRHTRRKQTRRHRHRRSRHRR
jgi:hypothetical protein